MAEGHVIIGGGPAAVAAVEAIRIRGDSSPVTVISGEEFPAYCRSLLAETVAGELEPGDLAWRGDDFYGTLGVNYLGGTRATGVNMASRDVDVKGGKKIPFKTLLLACGARPAGLSLPGVDLEGIHRLHDLSHAMALRAAAARGSKAVVIGGGLVGIEAAAALAKKKLKVTLVEQEAHLLPGVLDETAAGILAGALNEVGVEVLCQAALASFLEAGSKRLAGVKLVGGREIEADLAVLATGVVPNKELLEAAGARVARGVQVNEFLETSLPGIYAAGDVAEVWDPLLGENVVSGLWSAAVQQGKIAGANMAGGKERYQLRFTARHSGCVAGFSFVSLGRVNASDEDEIFCRRLGQGVYRLLVVRKERLVGALLVGDVAYAGIYGAYIDSGFCILGVVDSLLAGRPYLPLKRVNSL